MNVLVTGFDAFGTHGINPTEKIVNSLPKLIDNHSIHTLVLPTVQYQCIEKLLEQVALSSLSILITLRI